MSSPSTQGLDLSISLRGYVWVRLRSARRFAAAGLPPATYRSRFRWMPRGFTRGTWLTVMLVTYGAGSFHPARNAPLSRRTCHAHNQHAADKMYGPLFMKRARASVDRPAPEEGISSG